MNELKASLDRFREFVREWKFENGGGDNTPYQLCWSYDNRDKIDPERESDDIVLKYGNEVEFENIFSAPQFVLTVDDWLYILDARPLKRRLNGGNPTILLYRVNWDNIEIVDVNKLRVSKGGGLK